VELLQVEIFFLLAVIAVFGTMGTFISIETKRRNSAQSMRERDDKAALGRRNLTEGD
jgi:hypothetical protein